MALNAMLGEAHWRGAPEAAAATGTRATKPAPVPADKARGPPGRAGRGRRRDRHHRLVQPPGLTGAATRTSAPAARSTRSGAVRRAARLPPPWPMSSPTPVNRAPSRRTPSSPRSATSNARRSGASGRSSRRSRAGRRGRRRPHRERHPRHGPRELRPAARARPDDPRRGRRAGDARASPRCRASGSRTSSASTRTSRRSARPRRSCGPARGSSSRRTTRPGRARPSPTPGSAGPPPSCRPGRRRCSAWRSSPTTSATCATTGPGSSSSAGPARPPARR